MYEQSYEGLFEYGYRLTRNAALVEDTIQELFIKLWKNKSRLGDVASVKSYLLVAMRGAIYNKLEKDKKSRSEQLEDAYFDLTFSVESAFIEKETDEIRAQKITEALNQLTSRQKEFIYLRYYAELSYEEIATALNITVKASYKLNSRAIESLKQLIELPILFLLIQLFPFGK